MRIKNSNSLRKHKNNLVPKNKINTVQKRTIAGFHYTVTISPAVLVAANILKLFGIPFVLAVAMFSGFNMDNTDNAGYVASQIADNAESMAGQTDGAGAKL